MSTSYPGNPYRPGTAKAKAWDTAYKAGLTGSNTADDPYTANSTDHTAFVDGALARPSFRKIVGGEAANLKNKGVTQPVVPTVSATGGNVPGYVPAAYKSWVSQAAQATGLPASVVAAQINTESGFNPSVTSGAGAEGIAQFEPSTFAKYGSGSEYNAQDSLGAYSNYMNALLKQYNGNIRDALAAYNAGPQNLEGGYGYADGILSAAGLNQRSRSGIGTGGNQSYGGTRPDTAGNGNDSSSDSGDSSGGSGVDTLFDNYEAEVNSPRTMPQGFAPANSWKAPFQWWYASFMNNYDNENTSNGSS